jgi:excisionase family DNA binding protein
MAAMLRCHPTTVVRLRQAGKLPYIALGKAPRFRLVAIQDWMAKNSLCARKGVRAKRVAPYAEEMAQYDAEAGARRALFRHRNAAAEEAYLEPGRPVHIEAPCLCLRALNAQLYVCGRSTLKLLA